MKLTRHLAKLPFLLLTLAAIVTLAGAARAAGHGYRTIYRFQGGNDGWFPIGVPVADKDGNLYGGTNDGGKYDNGLVFKLTPPRSRGGAWTKSVVRDFTGGKDGGGPGRLAMGADGRLYGVATDRIFSLTPPTSKHHAWTYALLYALNETTDGDLIQGHLAFDLMGNIYGATEEGGYSGCGNGQGCGTVFELQRPKTKGGKWRFKVLHTFTGDPDGALPFAGVTFDQEGNLYGTTWAGGTADSGTVYHTSPPKKKGQGWSETVVHSFTERATGIGPGGPLTFDTAGNIYGTTISGGDLNCQAGTGCGLVFQLMPLTDKGVQWTYNTLYAFQGGNDGINPQGYMVFDSKGVLYSTTETGGGGPNYSGTAFRLNPSTLGSAEWTETVLHRFIDPEDAGPNDGLAWGKWGDLYGVTWLGGGTGCQGYGCGTVFELQP